MKRKYNYFYKIVNNINGHFYYGIHSTDDLNDGYMGSGIKLHKAFEKYGIENFSKEILKFFDTRDEAVLYEEEIVNEELVYDRTCYNIARGGELGNTIGTFTAYDKEEGCWRRITYFEYEQNKENFISSPTAGKVVVEEISHPGNHLVISSDEYQKNKNMYRALSGNSSRGKVVVTFRNNPGEFIKISADDYDKNLYMVPAEYYKLMGIHNIPATSIKNNSVCVKDKTGKYFFVSKDDERYINGELVLACKGYKWTDEQKERLKKAIAGKQRGEKNSQYGTKWINKNGEKIKIKKSELEKYLEDGWSLGMK